jgi:hypothetical protein
VDPNTPTVTPSRPPFAAFSFQPAGHAGPSRRSWARIGIALGAAVVVAVAAVVVLSTGQGSAAFALSLRRGTTYAYRLHMTFDGQGSIGKRRLPVAMSLDETMAWFVTGVEDDGTATVELTVKDMSGRVNGQPTPPVKATTTVLRVSSDGRVLTSGGSVSVDTGGFGNGIPGTDQLTPILPNRPVKPGDTWTKTFDQSNPVGRGRIHYDSKNRLDRYESVDGVRAAVITSDVSVPMDLTIDILKGLKLTGTSPEEAGIPRGSHPTVRMKGSTAFTMTNWFDREKGLPLKTTQSGQVDLTMSFRGLPRGEALPGDLNMSGRFTLEMQLAS